MEKIKSFKGKVVSQEVWFNDRNWRNNDNTKADVQTITLKVDYCGKYFLTPNVEAKTYIYKASWEELEIVKVADGLYHMKFYSVSSPYVRSDTPFLVLEMTRDEVINWHNNDVWFRKEMHYIVRRSGKKFTKAGEGKRCIKCRYLVKKDATECDRCQ